MGSLKKLFQIFGKKQKLQFVGLFIIIVIGSIFELLGVSMLVPFIQALLNPDKLLGNELVKKLANSLNITTTIQLSAFFVLACIFIYIIKNLYLVFSQYMQYQVIWRNRLKMEVSVMEHYVRQPYMFHVQRNSAEMQRTILTDIGNVFTVVSEVFLLASELLTTAMLVVFLMLTSKIITVVLLIGVGGFLLFYFKVFKRRLYEYGVIAQKYGMEGLKCIHQVFNGIKEIKVHRCEPYFVKEFRQGRIRQISMMKRASFFQQTPKYFLELVCTTGILGVLLAQIIAGLDVTQMVSQLAVFALAAYRILPSANRITSQLGVIYNNKASIDLIHEAMINDNISATGEMRTETEFGNAEIQNSTQGTNTTEIELKNVYFKYPKNEKWVLENVSLKIEKGKSVALKGESGSGKTTTADLILGILKPCDGEILYGNVDIATLGEAWYDKIGYIPQNVYLCDDSIRKNVAFGIENPDDEKVWKALESAQLKEFVEKLPDGLDMIIGESGVRLSGGQRQRIGIARALYENPDILILDEATSALDNETETAVMESINYLKGKKTLLIIAHRLSTIENCDEVYDVRDGKITRSR